jgi:hypothetical protein
MSNWMMKASILIILLTIACSLILVFVKPGYSQTTENITVPVVPQGTSPEKTGNNSTENNLTPRLRAQLS